MFNYSQYDLARWGVPLDTGSSELRGWQRQFAEEFYARLVKAPDDARVLGQARDLLYGVLTMNADEFVLQDAQQRERLLKKLWPHFLDRQREQPAEFDEAYRRGLRMHFEQVGRRGGDRVWLAQLDEIARAFREKQRAQPVKLPRADSLGTDQHPRGTKP